MKSLLFLFLLAMASTSVFSQASNSSISVGYGVTKMSGDIGGDDLGNIIANNFGHSISVGYRYETPINLGFRILGDYSTFAGKDTQAYNGPRIRFFNTTAYSLGAQVEYSIWGNRYVTEDFPHSIYFFAGPSYTYFDALQTEDPEVKKATWGIYGGIGYQFRFKKYFGLGVEVKQIQFFSDLVDGYDPNGANDKYNDTSFVGRLVLSFYLPQIIGTGGLWDY